MSKKLTPSQAWEEVKDEMLEWTEGYEENFDIIETALKKLEKIESVMPIDKPELLKESIDIVNKKLKRLEELEIMYSNCVIEGAKQKKALEIIKTKQVNVELLMKTKNATDYNKYSKDVNPCHNLGQRQYKLLKEVLL